MIDLHTHSTFSDGTFTPEALAALAGEIGLSAIALTDHDTLGGVPRFLAACAAVPGLEGVASVEISVEVKQGTMHILGHFVDPAHDELNAALIQMRGGRETRNARILERLQALGVDVTWDDVKRHAGDEVVGRPHFAKAMVRKGVVTKTAKAFDHWLGKGQPAYIDRFRLSPAAALRVIRAAGGVPVLAHPVSLGLKPKGLMVRLQELKSLGLAGLEVYYSEHTTRMASTYAAMAAELGLLASGGSDFHGAMNKDLKLGRGFGGLRVADELLEPLKAARGVSAESALRACGGVVQSGA